MPVTRILISNDGKVTIEGIGYVGKQCLTDLQKLVEALQRLGIEVNVEFQQEKPEAQMTSEVVAYES